MDKQQPGLGSDAAVAVDSGPAFPVQGGRNAAEPTAGAGESSGKGGSGAGKGGSGGTASGGTAGSGTAERPTCPDLPSNIAERWLVFDSDREGYNRDLYAVLADRTRLTRLTTKRATEREAALSPDGERLAYASDESGALQVHVLTLADGTLKQLTQLPAGADQPSWSSDGKQLVFHSGPSIHIMDADGANQREIAKGLDDFNAFKHPSLSPDSKVVVFDRNNEINAIGVDGTNMRYVVQNWTTTEETPAISPDGFLVAFSVWCAGQQIGVTPFAGYAADPCKVTFATRPIAAHDRHPAWGPEDWLAFERTAAPDSINTAAGTQIYITRGPGSEPCEVVSGPWQNLNPIWAPEGWEPPAAPQ